MKGARESSKELVPPAAAPTPSAYRPSQNHLGRNFRSGTTASKHKKKKERKMRKENDRKDRGKLKKGKGKAHAQKKNGAPRKVRNGRGGNIAPLQGRVSAAHKGVRTHAQRRCRVHNNTRRTDETRRQKATEPSAEAAIFAASFPPLGVTNGIIRHRDE